MSPGVIYSKTLGSPRGGARLMGPHGRLGGGGKPGPLLENEGGWSIPEAAGARGCLLGCAGPTRGSFRAATPAGGEKRRNGTTRARVGNSARPYGGSSRPWRAGLKLGGGAPGGGSTPSLDPVLPGLPWRRHTQAGGRQVLARGRNALKSVRSREALGTCAVQCMAVIS